MPSVTEKLPPQIPLCGEPDEYGETVQVGPDALLNGTILGVASLEDELAVPWSAAASDPLTFVLGVLRHDLPAADAGVTSRNAGIAAGDCVIALDSLPVLSEAQSAAPAHYRHVYRQLSARGIRITERAGE
ncbi:hypothetical protein [Paludibacterium denitrificans]|uniref:Uncharacterized protein n=1 Tax=Paludibacterium denitrificans TaxID=2675226 RepID=A0A844GB79_9NEIS|nr:hypothetical protein [Paludibacterium denitrificans]MTD33693.1 hypothetical protein [Paludibacterium denitrificans]